MPRTFPFLTVDAFTTQPLTGNSCAVVFDADGLGPDALDTLRANKLRSGLTVLGTPTPCSPSLGT